MAFRVLLRESTRESTRESQLVRVNSSCVDLPYVTGNLIPPGWHPERLQPLYLGFVAEGSS